MCACVCVCVCMCVYVCACERDREMIAVAYTEINTYRAHVGALWKDTKTSS